MSEPKPLNPTEQDALVKQIGLTLMRAAPEGWHHVTAEYRATGRYFELSAEVRSEDGSVRGWVPPQEVATLFARLRAGMHREGRGSWSNARYQLDQPSSYNLDFDRAEPKWQTPPPQQAYFDEMRFFPRSDENVPDWLRKWLQPVAPAAPVVPVAPPPRSFRTARVFDGAGPGGRPSVNRPPVPEHERDLLLDYLDRAPVAVVGRGFDADVLDPDSPSIVPVAFQTDGNWIWPSAVGYYLRTYGVPPEPELVEWARASEFRLADVPEEARVAAAANLGAPPAPRGTSLPQPAQLEVHVPDAEPEVQVAPLDDGFAAFADAHPLDLPEDYETAEYDPPGYRRSGYDPDATIAAALPDVGPQPESAYALEEEPPFEPMSPGTPDIEETADLVDLRPALADEVVESDFDQRQFDAAQDGPPYRVQFDHDVEPEPAVDDRYRRDSYVEGMDLFAPSAYERDESDTQAWSPFAEEEQAAPEPIDTGVEPRREPIPVDETEEEIQPEVLAAEAGLVEDDLVAAEPAFEVDADPRRHDDTTEFDIDQDTVFDLDPVAVAEPEPEPVPEPEPLPVVAPVPVPMPMPAPAAVAPEPVVARPRQVTPEEERELSGVRRALDDLDVPPAAYRFGEPADRTWGLRTSGEGWEVAWFDHGPNNPVHFDRVGDAAAFLIGKLVLGGRRAPRPVPPPLPPRQPQVNGFRDEGRRPPMPPPRPVEQVRPEPPRPEPVRPEVAARLDVPRPPEQLAESPSQAGRTWPIKPLNGEPPLTLFRHKKMIELPMGFEIDRFGEPNGNLCYAAGTPFEERSLVPSWINRPYRVYRLRRPVEVLTGVAVPWFEQPGGGTAYLFPKTVEDMIADGALVEVSNQEAQIH